MRRPLRPRIVRLLLDLDDDWLDVRAKILDGDGEKPNNFRSIGTSPEAILAAARAHGGTVVVRQVKRK